MTAFHDGNVPQTPQERLKSQHATGMSYSKIATFYGVSKAMAWRVANEGYEPVDDVIREKLGFPQIVFQTVYRNPDGTFKPKPPMP